MNARTRASRARRAAAFVGIFAFCAVGAIAGEGDVPAGVPGLDRVFVIVMENHGYAQIVGNPGMPLMNQYMQRANTATNYFAIGHPSLTNYLELVGGSNFGILNDNSPDWHNGSCTPALASGPPGPLICPIAGTGTDAAATQIDGVHSFPASGVVGKTIADQLAERGLTWKSYQESLPPDGADGVNTSDGFFSNWNPVSFSLPSETQTLIDLYAVKHNPFAYFRSIQEGTSSGASLANIDGFEGPQGLFADLGSGGVPAFSFIVPNQCNDQHGRGNAGPSCDFDPAPTGTQAGLNPALIRRGDQTLGTLVRTIHASPVWGSGRNAIVVVWDESDFSGTPDANRVLLTVETSYGTSGIRSSAFYTHFSLLKTLEAGFGLPCLNHACNVDVAVMADLFAPAPPSQVVPASPARFRATVSWSANGQTGSGNPIYVSAAAKGFWFFSPDNVELVVKVVDGRAFNGRFWVFYGSLTDVQFTLTVTDTMTGATKTYTNAQGQNSSVADAAAF